MIYLDYSATTPVDKEVLDSFEKVCINYIGNANSLHKLGRESFHLMDASSKQIADLLNVKKNEVIFTSGASESNNLAIIGSCLKYKNRGKHILTTKLEHSSVIETVNYLARNGFEVEYVNILKNGLIDIDDLVKKIRNDTLLVSICEVNSEIGIVQDVDKIGNLLKQYPKIIFHVDGTQAIGKIKVNLNNIDLYSFSSHKIYGLKGVGCLIKKSNIELEPIIHGGKSQTIYRSGTPTIAHYASFAKALKIALNDLDSKYNYVLKINNLIKKSISEIKEINIISNKNCIPHILNLSVKNIKPETLINALSEKEIYISTKTACASESDLSISVLELTKNQELAKSSIRISLSYKTTEEEVYIFLDAFKQIIKELSFKKGE